MKKPVITDRFMNGLFALLFVLSLASFWAGYDIGDFSFSHIRHHLYFQAWISWAVFSLALVLGCACWIIHKRCRLKEFKLMAWSLWVFALAMVPIGFHNEYCKWCSDLGICGSAHNYPNALSLLAMCFYTVVFVVYGPLDSSEKGRVLRLLVKAFLVGFGAMLTLLLVGIFAMELPSPIPYKKGSLNPQGMIFLSISIFSAVAFFQWMGVKWKEHRQLCLFTGGTFLIIALVQLPAAYHIFTCYWCDVEECSEFFSVGGILILVSVYLFWRACWLAFRDSVEGDDGH